MQTCHTILHIHNKSFQKNILLKCVFVIIIIYQEGNSFVIPNTYSYNHEWIIQIRASRPARCDSGGAISTLWKLFYSIFASQSALRFICSYQVKKHVCGMASSFCTYTQIHSVFVDLVTTNKGRNASLREIKLKSIAKIFK